MFVGVGAGVFVGVGAAVGVDVGLGVGVAVGLRGGVGAGGTPIPPPPVPRLVPPPPPALPGVLVGAPGVFGSGVGVPSVLVQSGMDGPDCAFASGGRSTPPELRVPAIKRAKKLTNSMPPRARLNCLVREACCMRRQSPSASTPRVRHADAATPSRRFMGCSDGELMDGVVPAVIGSRTSSHSSPSEVVADIPSTSRSTAHPLHQGTAR